MATISWSSNQILHAGDEVAILPLSDSPPAEVLEIALVMHVGSVFLQLTDGRMYATLGGKCLGTKFIGYAVPATDEYRDALRTKSGRSTSNA